jgi:hypothetical protein
VGHKKVASIEFAGLFYMAELNDVYFNGSVSALNGTFAGTLTANAVNALSKLNISGNAVAIDTATVTSRFPASGYLRENFTESVFTVSINVPDTAGQAMLIVTGEWVNADTDDSQRNFYGRRAYYFNGAAIHTDAWNNYYYYFGARLQDRFFVPVTPGINTFNMTFQTGNGDTTPLMYIKDLGVRLTYVRK